MRLTTREVNEMNDLYERLVKKEAKLAVIGLGYVGLPLAADSKPFGFMPFRNRKNTVPL